LIERFEDFNAQRDEDIYLVVRNVAIDFKAPVRDPGELLIRYRVTRVRAAGVTTAFEIWSGDRQTLHGKGERTVCKLSGKTHQPTEWTKAFRAQLEKR